ncbi:MAG: SDR family NAD(P)-dependent oxidoreductase, partial [Pseudomonadota bacterium]
MMDSLNGKTVVVVGGGSGIGKAVAKAASDEGASVVLSSRTQSKLAQVAETFDGASVVP